MRQFIATILLSLVQLTVSAQQLQGAVWPIININDSLYIFDFRKSPMQIEVFPSVAQINGQRTSICQTNGEHLLSTSSFGLYDKNFIETPRSILYTGSNQFGALAAGSLIVPNSDSILKIITPLFRSTFRPDLINRPAILQFNKKLNSGLGDLSNDSNSIKTISLQRHLGLLGIMKKGIKQWLLIAPRSGSITDSIITAYDLDDINLRTIVQSSIPIINTGAEQAIKISTNSSFLLISNGLDSIGIYNFNIQTGKILKLNSIFYNQITQYSFSTLSNIFYYSERFSSLGRPGELNKINLFQVLFDTLNGSIISKKLVYSDSSQSTLNFGGISYAIDGKLYFFSGPNGKFDLFIIDCPNSATSSLMVRKSAISFNTFVGPTFPTLNQTLFVNADKLQITPTKGRLCLGESTDLIAYGATTDVFAWQPSPYLDSLNINRPTFTPTDTGSYTFTVTGTSACTTATASVTIRVLPQPVASLGADKALCTGQQLNLQVPQQAGVRYAWNTGDTTRSITVSDTGRYWVEVSNGNCSVFDTVQLFEGQAPAAPSIAGTDTVCQGGSTVLSGPAGFNLYRWSTGATSPSITAGPGSYTVEVAQSPGCYSPASNTFAVIEIPKPSPPIIQISEDSICTGESASLQITNPNLLQRYIWNTGDTSTLITVNQTGWYKARTFLPFSNCLSAWSDSVFLQVVPAPSISSIVGPTRICPGQQGAVYRVSASNTSSIVWQVQGGTIASQSGNTVVLNWAGSGAGQVQALARGFRGCPADTLTLPITINPVLQPQVTVGDTLICIKDQVATYTINPVDDLPGSTYTWSITNGQILAGQGTSTIQVQWAGSGSLRFNQRITTRDTVCQGDSPLLNVEVLEPITITNTPAVCEGDSISIAINSSTNYSYTINYNNQSVASNQAKFRVESPANNSFSITYNYKTCSGDSTVFFSTYPLPRPSYTTPTTTLCPADFEGITYTINGLPNSSYTHTVIGGTLLNQQGNTLTILWDQNADRYEISTTETSVEGCASAPISLSLSKPAVPAAPGSGCDPSTFPLRIPNVITPNGDGVNDRFVIENLEYYPPFSLRIINRWGQTIFETSEYRTDWIGDVAAGVYFYQLSGQGTYRGTVSVLR